MNNQEAFNKVCAHLKQQGACSLDERNDGCVYAGEDGRACAVGALLPRSLCEELDMLSNTSWTGVLRAAARGDEHATDAVKLLAGVDNELLITLQSAHDHMESHDQDSDGPFWGEELKEDLRAIAKKFSLELPPELAS